MISDEHELIQHVRKRASSSFHLTSIDGASGSGKSTTMSRIAEALPCDSVDLDNLVSGDAPTYLDRIDHERLRKRISEARAERRLILVAGICVLAALERISERPQTLVYIQRISANSGEPAEPYLFDEDSEWYKELSLDPSEEARKPFDDPQEWIDRQVGAYHKRFKPLEQAHLVFRRKE